MSVKKPSKGKASAKRLLGSARQTAQPVDRARLAVKRREAFVEAYLGPCAMNGAAAARAAGYAVASADVEAARLLKEPEVAARVEAHLAARAAKSSVTLATITASLLEMSEGRTLATVGVSEGTPIMGEPKHSDRLKATELLARLHGLDRHQVDLAIVPASAEALRRAAEARERVEAAERELTGEVE